MSESSLRRDLVRYSHAMYAAGWVANHDGNLSARVAPDRVVCTPTAFSKADVGLDDLLVVSSDGTRIAGRHRPFSELALHRAVYAQRPDVQAVVHAHPPFATAFGAAGQAIPHPFLPEAVVSLGATLPLVPLTAPGQPSVDALRPWITRCDAVVIAGNGVLTWGPSLELAYLRMELVEHLARIAHGAVALGGVKPLPQSLTDALVSKRAKAGLAAPDEGRAPERPSASAQSDHSARADIVHRVQAGLPNADPALIAQLVAQIAAGQGAR